MSKKLNKKYYFAVLEEDNEDEADSTLRPHYINIGAKHTVFEYEIDAHEMIELMQVLWSFARGKGK